MLDPDHSSTLTSLNNLANLYKSQSKYNQAEPLSTSTGRGLGPGHSAMATSLNNLAAFYKSILIIPWLIMLILTK